MKYLKYHTKQRNQKNIPDLLLLIPSLAAAVIHRDLQSLLLTSGSSQLNFTSDLFLRVQKHCTTSDTYWNMSAPQVLTSSGFGPQFSGSCDNSHIKINQEAPQKVPQQPPSSS